MNRARRRGLCLAVISGGLALATQHVGAAEAPPVGEPFAIDATALVRLDDETAVSIRGMHGLITVATSDERELRVVSRRPGPDGAELPVGLWQYGNKLIVSGAPGDDGGPRQVRVEVPRSFTISVEADASDVSIQSPAGSVDLRGRDTRALIDGSVGSLYVELVGGSLTVVESDEVTARLQGTVTKIAAISGNVNLRATGGTIELGKIRGPVEVDCEDTKLTVNDTSGSVRVKARNGEAVLTALKAGAELQLAGTPLVLKEGKGDITVTSDAAVVFQSMAAALHFDMYGGSLRGKGNDGILEVRTRNTEVTVETIQQGMRIQGDGLKAHLEDVGGELYIETSISDVVVDRAGSVILLLDRGTATVKRAAGAVQANVVGGDVQILDGDGSVELEMDRGDATVSWASMSGDKDSKLVNKGGNIAVRFPASGACRVEAKTKFGRIESDLPTVRVMDDQTEAQGPVNGGYRPIIHIAASGDVRLQSAAKPHEDD